MSDQKSTKDVGFKNYVLEFAHMVLLGMGISRRDWERFSDAVSKDGDVQWYQAMMSERALLHLLRTSQGIGRHHDYQIDDICPIRLRSALVGALNEYKMVLGRRSSQLTPEEMLAAREMERESLGMNEWVMPPVGVRRNGH